jgi:hypothetical protein
MEKGRRTDKGKRIGKEKKSGERTGRKCEPHSLESLQRRRGFG